MSVEAVKENDWAVTLRGNGCTSEQQRTQGRLLEEAPIQSDLLWNIYCGEVPEVCQVTGRILQQLCWKKKPVQLLRRHPGALHPSPALAWPGSPATLTPTDLSLEPVCLYKERKILQMLLIAPSLICKNSCLKKNTSYMKTPDGKMKKCAMVKCAQQEWNIGIPGLSFVPKLNVAMLKHMMLQ